MTDKVSFNDPDGRVIATRDSSIVPEAGETVQILDDDIAEASVFTVENVEYSLTKSDVIANVTISPNHD